jgi:glycosyltransferase involved in cell wall biosynthesis
MPNYKNMSLELVLTLIDTTEEYIYTTLQSVKDIIDFWTVIGPEKYRNFIEKELSSINGSYNTPLESHCTYKLFLEQNQILCGASELKKYIMKENKDVYLLNNIVKDDVMYYTACICKTSLMSQNRSYIDETIFVQVCRPVDKYDTFNKYILKLKESDNFPLLERCNLLYNTAYYSKDIDPFRSREFFKKLKKIVTDDKDELDNKAKREFLFISQYEIACHNLELKGAEYKDHYHKKMMELQQQYPERIESYFKLCYDLYREQQYEGIVQMVNHLQKFPKPCLLYTILDLKIYDYYIPYMCIDINIKLKDLQTAVMVLKRTLLKFPCDQPLLNIKYAIATKIDKKIKRISDTNKTVVIHMGGFGHAWDPKTETNISGSEYMAMNMAKELVRLNYNVFVFGYFKDPFMKLDYQGIYDDVQYVDTTLYPGFTCNYYIDYLIVSRYTQFLTYYDNIENVYLWCHDISPILGTFNLFQTHPTKFKGIIALSDWHKLSIMSHINVPREMIIVSRNAIYTERFNDSSVVKTPFRFIYMSDYMRGLSNLVDMVPDIKSRYPSSIFVVYCKLHQIPEECLEKIKNINNKEEGTIVLNGRTTQENISKELLKSDIWLYPTTFKETYCISALEAMCARCLIATVNLAGLGNIVGDRGIMIEENEPWKKLLDKLYEVLEDPIKKESYLNRAKEWSMLQSYSDLAAEWNNMFLSETNLIGGKT